MLQTPCVHVGEALAESAFWYRDLDLMRIPAVVFGPLLVGWLGAKLGNMILAQRNPLSGIKRWEDKIVEELAPDSRHPLPVVLVPWPSAEVRSLALLTETYKDPSGEGLLASVCIPNTPPRTGFLRVVPTNQLVHTEWTLPDLLQYHWSSGSGGRELFSEGREPSFTELESIQAKTRCQTNAMSETMIVPAKATAMYSERPIIQQRSPLLVHSAPT